MSRIGQLIKYLFLGIFYIFFVKKISNNNKMFENISNFNLKAIIKYILNNTINVILCLYIICLCCNCMAM